MMMMDNNRKEALDKATKAKHVLLVADSCFSGTLMRSGTNIQNQDPIH